MLLLILGVVFVLGWPLEWVPIVVVVVPIMLPLVRELGIDMLWFSIAGRGLHADRLAVAAGGAVGLLPARRGAALASSATSTRA